MTAERAADLRRSILELVAEDHVEAFVEHEFIPGQTPIPVSGRVFDADELQHLVDASLDFWLTTGRFAEQFEREDHRPGRDPSIGAGSACPAAYQGMTLTRGAALQRHPDGTRHTA